MAYTSLLPGLGDAFNACAIAGVPIDMRQADAVTFYTYKDDGDQTVTLNESVGDGTSQELAKIETLYKKPGVGGAWTEVTQAASASYTHADPTNDLVAFTVSSAMLSPGFTHVFTSWTSTPVLCVTHKLRNKRAPERLLADSTGTHPGLALINNRFAFFTTIDADRQEYPNLVPGTSDVMTRGSTTGVDTSDPRVAEKKTRPHVAGFTVDGSYISTGPVTSVDAPTTVDIRVDMSSYSSAPSQNLRPLTGRCILEMRRPTGHVYLTTYNGSSYDPTGFLSYDWTAEDGVSDIQYRVSSTAGGTQYLYRRYGTADLLSDSGWEQVDSAAAAATYSSWTASGHSISSGSVYLFPERLYRVTMTADSTLEIDMNASDNTTGDPNSWVSGGRTYTIVRPATGNEAVWVAANQSFAQSDGLDDYFQLPTSCTPTFDATTGEYAAFVCGRHYNSGPTAAILGAGTSASYRGFSLYASSLSNATATVRDDIGGIEVDTLPALTIEDGTPYVIGGKAVNGQLYVYYQDDGLSTTPADYSSQGALSFGAPRLFVSQADDTTAPMHMDFFSVAIATEDCHFTEDEMNAVAAYMQSLV